MLQIQSILVPIDFSSSASHALEVARALARDHHAKLLLFAVAVPSQATMDTVLPESVQSTEPSSSSAWPHTEKVFQRDLDNIAAGIGDLPVETEVRIGAPGAAIVSAARDAQVDLIVMGTQGRTGLPRLLLGSVAEYVLRHAPCPVLTIKPGTETHLQQ